MHLVPFHRHASGCVSYLVGSSERGVCVIVDPAWEVEGYLRAADQRGLRITHVVETHAHADHLSGARRLAEATGSVILTHPTFDAAFPCQPLADEERLEMGEVSLTALHTPGHRPDSLCLLTTDASRGEAPCCVLTGDTLFVGDVGRPDLGQEVEEGATQLYESLARLLRLPDYVEVYPAHVAGSSCGRSMSHKGASTLGFERLFNPALQTRSLQEFVARVVHGLPPQPPNFLTIVAKNRGLLPIREEAPRPVQSEAFRDLQQRGRVVVDLRSPTSFGAGAIAGSINVPFRMGHLPTTAGWAVPVERPLLLVLDRDDDAPSAGDALRSVGLDRVDGYLAGGVEAWRRSGLPVRTLRQVDPERLRAALADADAPTLVDVRPREDWERGHVPGALSVPLGELERTLSELPPGRPVAFVCNGGVNSAAAASIAAGHGLEAWNVAGGTVAWRKAGLPVEGQ